MNVTKYFMYLLSFFSGWASILLADEVKAPVGFEVSLFASRPEINSPTCVTASPDGKVFVGVGPNSSLGKEKDVGKIVCCEDKDQDGKADKFTVFARVDRPRGLFYNQGKLWVLHPPTLSLFTDTDGDNIADKSEVLVSNISTDMTFKRGADHTTNGFAVGIDGWLYVAVGDFGFYKAKGTDGKRLSNQGGGVLRVRPDGSEMEMYSSGLRNIYDVAVDPCLNIFSRDNTNDGGGWNVRFSHIIGGKAEYGYPKYYNNFPEDMVPCLEDYGGGSGVGSLAVYEPDTFPGKFGHTIYTADWGTSKVYWHDLQSNGPSFKPKQSEFVGVGKVSDLAIDGLGSMFVTAFGSDYQYGEDRGDVYQLKSNQSVSSIGLDNIHELAPKALIELFKTKSHTVHQNLQFEILRRGQSDELVVGLQSIVKDAKLELIHRIAALFTLKQLSGVESHLFLGSLFEDNLLREYAIKALADRKTQLKNIPELDMITFAEDPNPRVRMQVAIALGRIGGLNSVEALLGMTNDNEPLVQHLANKSLEHLRPIEVCLNYVENQKVDRIQGALKVLYRIHGMKVVQGLKAILENSSIEQKKIAVIKTLFRLYHKEMDWKGGWWGTRPFSQGPYVNAVKWKASKEIEQILIKHIALLSQETQLNLAGDVLRNRIDAKKLKLNLPSELMIHYIPKKIASVPALKSMATDPKEGIEIRIKAFKILQEITGIDSLKAQIEILGDCLGEDLGDFEQLESEFIYSTPIADSKMINIIFKAYIMAKKSGQWQLKETKHSETALRLLMVVWNSSLSDASTKAKIKSFFKYMKDSETFYKVIGDLNIESMRSYVIAAKKREKVSNIAISALNKLNENRNTDDRKVVDFDYSELEEELLNTKGEVALGEHLFIRQSCIVCHSVNTDQPNKGPYLGASGAMFTRKDLIESIVKPNANLSQGFQTVHITLKNNETKVGFVTKEVDGEVHLRDIMGGTHYLLEKEIKSRVQSPVSMMPAGLTNNLNLPEMASLLDYLASLNNY